MNKPITTEPSMDEILASIRRIISEDDASMHRAPHLSAAPAPSAPMPTAPADDDDDVLLLTRRAPIETHVAHAVAEAARVNEETGLVSQDAARNAAASFEKLSLAIAQPAPVALSGGNVAVSASGPTLEDITRDLLRPMISSWLENNLPAIVQARVDEEVARIASSRTR